MFPVSLLFNPDYFLFKLERDHDQLIQQTIRQLNSHFGRRTEPSVIHRFKVTFKNEPGEGSGVTRSFFTAIGNAFMAADKLPKLENLTTAPSASKFIAFNTCTGQTALTLYWIDLHVLNCLLSERR